MGGVLAHDAALFEGGHDEGNVALLEVTDAAVNQFGGAAAGALAEVVGFQQGYAEAARGRVDGDTHAGGAAADDHNVPRFAPIADSANHFFSAHRLLRFSGFL